MFLVDFEKGELLDDERIKSDFAKQNPYQDWLDEQTIHLSELHCENEACKYHQATRQCVCLH
jgi:glutamate synthase (NADPH/NADH) large chain